MGVLKKGAKGKDVQKLQERLNALGAKLNVDSDFGAKTEAAVKAFQKKAKLKADGKVGDWTNAALKLGKALPVMEISDAQQHKKFYQETWLMWQKSVVTLLDIEKETTALDNLWEKNSKEMDKLFAATYKHWEKVAALCENMIKTQEEFDKVLLSNPVKAEKLAADCKSDNATIHAIMKAKIAPNGKRSKALSIESRKKFNESSKKIGDLLGQIDKRMA